MKTFIFYYNGELTPNANLLLSKLISIALQTNNVFNYPFKQCKKDFNFSNSTYTRQIDELVSKKIIHFDENHFNMSINCSYLEDAKTSFSLFFNELTNNQKENDDYIYINNINNINNLDINKINKEKEKEKIKKEKEKENFSICKISYPATKEEVLTLFVEYKQKYLNKFPQLDYVDLDFEAEQFFEYWISNNWKRNGKKVNSIKGTVNTWLQNKIKNIRVTPNAKPQVETDEQRFTRLAKEMFGDDFNPEPLDVECEVANEH